MEGKFFFRIREDGGSLAVGSTSTRARPSCRANPGPSSSRTSYLAYPAICVRLASVERAQLKSSSGGVVALRRAQAIGVRRGGALQRDGGMSDWLAASLSYGFLSRPGRHAPRSCTTVVFRGSSRTPPSSAVSRRRYGLVDQEALGAIGQREAPAAERRKRDSIPIEDARRQKKVRPAPRHARPLPASPGGAPRRARSGARAADDDIRAPVGKAVRLDGLRPEARGGRPGSEPGRERAHDARWQPGPDPTGADVIAPG